MNRIKIENVDAKYQSLARSIDCPTVRNNKGQVVNDYAQSEKLYSEKKKNFLAKNNLQANDPSMIATFNNGVIEGWEYKCLYKKVRADVEQEVARNNFNGESIFDSIFGTNTTQNKKDSLVAQLMRKYLGA